MANDRLVGVAAIAILTLGSVPPIYATLLPDKFTIQRLPLSNKDSDDFVSSVRNEEITASALSFALGVSGSILTNSPWPLLGVMILIGVFVWKYETSLRANQSNSYTDVRDDM